ncbi:MAG: hypothetical protein Ta2A_17040 [Treponemataceae bacterium]|nr:MAG: hypothetical protein Ta2A_17040 [Treponemataceae bacterium]
MPTVRNLPLFPAGNINIGDVWSQPGHEVQDFSFWGFNKPFRIPFTARYRFAGVEGEGSKLPLQTIDVEYDINYNTEPAFKKQLTAAQLKNEYPVRMTGNAKQRIFWNNAKGEIDHYTESFEIEIKTSSGAVYKFVATAKAQVYYDDVNVPEAVTKAEKAITDTGIQNVTVSEDERGFTITLEDIKFEADSAVLAESEKEKLKKIAEILEKYPHNDLLVSGHTALAGNADGRKKLSEERAGAVADFLVGQGVRYRNEVFIQGFGADKPIAPNTNPKDMARNRRVEITVLTKQ